jgi:enoyl-CoA hydratase/carnithine racemase
MLDRLERRARELGENDYALSERQFARLEAGEIKTAPRQANRRVIEAEFGKPYEDLISTAENHAAGMSAVVSTAIDASPTQHFAAIIGHLAQLDHQQGPRGVLDPAVAVYRSVLSTAKTLQSKEHDECLRLAARCAELIGWLCQDSGRPQPGREWTIQALDLAETVDAGELIPYVLMRRSAIAIDLGAPDDALLLAERALRHGRSGPDRALAFREVAAAHALNGNGRDFREAVDRALDYAGGGETRTPLAPYCTIPYLHSEAGASALILGDAKLAVSYLETAVREWPGGQPRDRAVCLARLALACANTREVERAATVALEAATAASAAPSPRPEDVWLGGGEACEECVLRATASVGGHFDGEHPGDQVWTQDRDLDCCGEQGAAYVKADCGGVGVQPTVGFGPAGDHRAQRVGLLGGDDRQVVKPDGPAGRRGDEQVPVLAVLVGQRPGFGVVAAGSGDAACRCRLAAPGGSGDVEQACGALALGLGLGEHPGDHEGPVCRLDPHELPQVVEIATRLR